MKLVVTGGTGLVGSALVKNLLSAGHEVTVLTRDVAKRTGTPYDPDDAYPVYVHWDAKTDGGWMGAIDGCDAVVNLTGENLGARRWSGRQKSLIMSSRVDATQAIVRAIAGAARKPPVFVSASAVGYYGSVTGGNVTEDHPPGSDFLADVCKAWESASEQASQYGIRVVRTRFSFVVGRSAEALRRMALPFRLFAGGWLGSGSQWFPWVHVGDLVAAVIFVIRNQAISGAVNIASPEPPTNKEFCKTLGRVLHRPCWAPAPAFALQMGLGEMSHMILTGQRAVPVKLLESGFSFQFTDAEAALGDALASEE